MKTLIRFGCKECTSPHVREKDGKLHCTTCGAWFEKNVETDEERDARVLYLTRLDRAEELLSMSPPRFDDAEDHFRKFIKDYPDHSDGYWGLVRARYGIKYEDDVTGKKIPSCYKSSYEDFRKDTDFMKAVSLAENDNIYDNLQEQAKLIAGVCKEWREEAGKYNYDIFISFKDEDKSLGISDEDRNEMNGLYDFLKDEGYSVFFSPRSMRRHTGKHYDAYIFNALQSARFMIVYGSRPEYFTATWVQNEWTRFLRMVTNGKKKKGSCIVIFNKFNPKELPHDLEKLQAVDASQKRYYIDILNCVKDILAEEKKVDTNEELMRKIEELKRQNEESQKRQEELQKSLEEEKKKNSAKAEQKPTATSDGKKETQKTPQKSTAGKPAQPAAAKPSASTEAKAKENENINVDPDFEIVKGTLIKYKGNKANVVIPDNVKSIGEFAFSRCKELTSVTLPGNVTSIGKFAFYYCSNLTSVALPNNVTTIGYSAFEGCSALSSVTIPNSVGTIGNCAFEGCASLASVVIPTNVNFIGDSAFKNCGILTIWVKSQKQFNKWDSVWNPDNRPVRIFGKGTEVKNTTSNKPSSTAKSPTAKPSTATVAKPSATAQKPTAKPNATAAAKPQESKKPNLDPDFEIVDGCLLKYKGNKTNVVIPEGVTGIEEYAFLNSDGIISVTIPQSITSIGYCSFVGCCNLTNILVDENNRHYKSIDGNLYTKDGTKLLQYASGKKNATFEILETVSKIEETAFYGCETLSSITVDKKNKYYMAVDGALYTKDGKALVKYAIGKKDNSFKIIDGVESIGSWAFTDCYHLSSVYIPNTVTNIGAFAFRGCTNIIDVVIPNSVKTIRGYAFALCMKMNSIVIGDGVTDIGFGVFSGCESLKNATIPDSVTSIGKDAFKDCKSLTIWVNDQNQINKWEAGWNPDNRPVRVIEQAKKPKDDPDFEIVKGTLIKYKGNKANVVIPDNVKSIGEFAFSRCKELTSVTLPGNVTSIGKFAFYYCSNLTSVALPNNVTTIGYSAFEGCSALSSVTIPNSVATIGNCAFEGCSGLTSVVIPTNVTSIGHSAFGDCAILTIWVNDQNQINKWDSVWNPDNRPVRIFGKGTEVKNTTSNKPSSTAKSPTAKPSTATVAKPSATAQKPTAKPNATAAAKPQESKKPNLDPDFEIVDGCLKKYKGNKAVVIIPDGVTSIGNKAFYHCSSLKSVIIPNSVISIGNSAFCDCSSLASVTIPDSIASIGDGVFSYCQSLTSITVGKNNTRYKSINGNLYTIDEKTLVQYAIGKKDASFKIPKSVKFIGRSAFSGCESLASVTIPDSVEFIGWFTFSLCSSLTSVNFEDTKGWRAGELVKVPILFLNNPSIAAKQLTSILGESDWAKKQ